MPADLSIIVPVFNEADNIWPLAREVVAAFRQQSLVYELIFVDDASTDATWEKIQEVRGIALCVRGLRHARNCGQSAALWTGLQAATGPVLATLDGDMQNDPADLPRLLAELAGVDFVCGVRVNRKDDFVRRASSRIARWARKTVLGVDFRDSACSLRVFKRAALDGVMPFNGWHRFLPILVSGGGVTTKEVAVNHRPRTSGVSKYGVWDRLGRGIVDLFAMAWFQKRRLRPVAVTELPPAVPPPSQSLS